MYTRLKLLNALLLTFILFGCQQKNKQEVLTGMKGKPESMELVADSIKYEVVVKPTGEDPWESERLFGYTNHKVFVECLLKSIYSGKITAYNYSTDEPLASSEVRSIMEALKPDWSEIGKLLFTERWYIDSTGILRKQITSITLGKAEYSKQGTFKGYSALFKVKYN